MQFPRMMKVWASIWGTILFFIGERNFAEGWSILLFFVPVAGLPWLIYFVHDNEKRGKRTTAIDIFSGIFAGGLYTMLCAIPLIFLIGIGIHLLR